MKSANFEAPQPADLKWFYAEILVTPQVLSLGRHPELSCALV